MHSGAAEERHEHLDVRIGGGFVESDPDGVRAELPQIATDTLRALHQVGGGRIAQFHPNRVEESFVGDFEAELLQPSRQLRREAVHALGDCAQPARTMIDRIHRSHHREKHLRRANVTRRLVTTDVLLARLQGEAISRPSFRIVRNAHESARQVALVRIARRHVGGVWSAESERNAETLGVAHGDIGSEFARRSQQRETQQIRRHNYERAGFVCALREVGIVKDRSISRGVLQEHAKNGFGEVEGGVISDDDAQAERLGARLHDLDRLRMAQFGNEKAVTTARRPRDKASLLPRRRSLRRAWKRWRCRAPSDR